MMCLKHRWHGKNIFCCKICLKTLETIDPDPYHCPRCDAPINFTSSGQHLLQVPQELFQANIFPYQNSLKDISSIKSTCSDIREYARDCSENIHSLFLRLHNARSVCKPNLRYLMPIPKKLKIRKACLLANGHMLFLSDKEINIRYRSGGQYLYSASRLRKKPSDKQVCCMNIYQYPASDTDKYLLAVGTSHPQHGSYQIEIFDITLGNTFFRCKQREGYFYSEKLDLIRNILFMSPERIIFTRKREIHELNIENNTITLLCNISKVGWAESGISALAKFSPCQIIFAIDAKIMLLDLSKLNEGAKEVHKLENLNEKNFQVYVLPKKRIFSMSSRHYLGEQEKFYVREWFPDSSSRLIDQIGSKETYMHCEFSRFPIDSVYNKFGLIINKEVFLWQL